MDGNLKKKLARNFIITAAVGLPLCTAFYAAIAFIPGLYEWASGDPKQDFAAGIAGSVLYFVMFLGALSALDTTLREFRSREVADRAAVADQPAVR